MILNFFSFTITITKKPPSSEKALQNELVEKIFEENQKKIENYIGPRQY